MRVFSATYTDIVKFNRKPNEDFFLVSLISKEYPIFTIADGVTQSRFDSGAYSFPAGARAAAEIFCYTVVDSLEGSIPLAKKVEDGRIDEAIKMYIGKSFDGANKRIEMLNKNEGITDNLDFCVYDYFDTVGIVGFIKNHVLYYGYVGDCGLSVFDKNNNLRFQTEDGVKPAIESAKNIYKKKWQDFSKREKNIIMRKYFRNNLMGIGYGSFTGEEGVSRYYKIDSLIPNQDDLVVLHSDGFTPYLGSKKIIEILRKGDKKVLDEFSLKKAKENPEKFGCDRTLIAINY